MIKVGDIAYNFSLPDCTGKMYSLSDFKGKKVVLYFYPKDNTSGCTLQACNYAKNYNELKKLNVTLIGISKDSEKSHKKFIEEFNLPFLILSDVDKIACTHYEVLKEKSMFGKKYLGVVRTTFIIDENGIITHIFKNVKASEDAKNILNILTQKKNVKI